MQRLGRTVATVLAALCGVVGAVSLAAFGGVWFWQLDLLTPFRPQFAVVGVVGAAATATRRWWWWSGGFVAVVLANAVPVVPVLVGAPTEPAGGAALEVLTFNVRASQPGRAETVEWLGTLDVDVMVLTEASTDWEHDLIDADLPYTLAFPRPPGNVFGTAVLYKEGRNVRAFRFAPNQTQVVALTVDLDGDEVEILAVHPFSPTSAFRADSRNDQFADIEEWVAGRDRSAIVVGDFNATPWSHAFPRRGLVNSLTGFGYQASWPVGWEPLTIPIDHLLHTADLTTIGRVVGPDQGSDHYPVFVTIGRAAP